MGKILIAAAAAATAALVLTGCGSIDSALGPSCEDFNNASANEQQEMVLDWMVENGDAPEGASMTDQGSGLLPIGAEVMQWQQQFASTCAANPDDRLSNYEPTF